MYIGVNNIARKISNCYVGVDGIARKVKAVYVGVDGKARLVWQAIKKKVTTPKTNTQQTVIVDADNCLESVTSIYNYNDEFLLFGGTVRNADDQSLKTIYLYKCSLNEDGSISKFSTLYSWGTSHYSQSVSIGSIIKLDDTYGAFLTRSTTTISETAHINVFLLNDLEKFNNSPSGKIYYSINSINQYGISLIKLNDNIILYAYSNGELPYGQFYNFKNEEIKSLTSARFFDINTIDTSASPPMETCDAISPLVFSLSNNRIGAIYAIKSRYSDDITSETTKIVVVIYSYSCGIDSNNNETVNTTLLATHIIPYASYIMYITAIDDDYFIASSYWGAFGFHIDANNNVTTTNYICENNVSAYPTRIGKSDCIYQSTDNKSCIFCYDKNTDILSLHTINSGISGLSIHYKDQEILRPKFYLGDLIFYRTSFE